MNLLNHRTIPPALSSLVYPEIFCRRSEPQPNLKPELTFICIVHVSAQSEPVLDARKELDVERALPRGEQLLGAVARGGRERVVRLGAG